MRVWTVTPRYLDSIGLVALWRETLLAKKVLEGNTKGYKYHPQLDRFKNHPNPVEAINTYLKYLLKESKARDYNFNESKIGKKFSKIKINVSKKFVNEEFKVLKQKLKKRNFEKYKEIKNVKNPDLVPIFKIST